jgi:hypothetical protein
MEFGGNFVYVGEEETQEIYEDFEDLITEETPYGNTLFETSCFLVYF